MDFSLTQQQDSICRAIREMAVSRLNNSIFQDDEDGTFRHDNWAHLGKTGLCGLPIPEAYGGQNLDMLTTALAIEALAESCHDEGLVFSLCAHLCTCAVPLWKHGTQWQKETFLTGLATGRLVGGNGMTEESAGSDVSGIKTMVEKNGMGYTLNGSKLFVTNGPVADALVIYGSHGDGMAMANISAFIIDKETPGISVGQSFDKMGLRTSPMSEILLNKCQLEEGFLLGRERMGIQVFQDSMLWERILMSAYHVGAMAQQYKSACHHAETRSQSGKKIIKHPPVYERLVTMKVRLESAKQLLYRICWQYDTGQATLSDASMIKLVSSEAKVKNSRDAIQIFGGAGYMKGSHIERQLRDAIAATIYSGTSDIQKKIIGENL